MHLDCSKYAESVGKLCVKFTRFADFRKSETEFKLFSQPFPMIPEDSPDCRPMELIRLQSDTNSRAYNSNDLVIFNKNYICGKHINLVYHAKKMTSLFGST